jgi:hypothetical protein
VEVGEDGAGEVGEAGAGAGEVGKVVVERAWLGSGEGVGEGRVWWFGTWSKVQYSAGCRYASSHGGQTLLDKCQPVNACSPIHVITRFRSVYFMT